MKRLSCSSLSLGYLRFTNLLEASKIPMSIVAINNFSRNIKPINQNLNIIMYKSKTDKTQKLIAPLVKELVR